jgi:hypothetical protein
MPEVILLLTSSGEQRDEINEEPRFGSTDEVTKEAANSRFQEIGDWVFDNGEKLAGN